MNYFPVIFYTLLIGVAWIFVPHPVIVVAAGILPIIVTQVIKYPYVLCLGFIVFSFFRIHEVYPVLNPLKIPSLLALGSLSVLAWHLFITQEIQVYWSRQLGWFAIFFTLVVFGVPFATHRPFAIAYFTGVFVKIGIMALAIAWLSRQPKDFLLASRLFTFSGVLVAITAITNKMNGIGLVEGTRVTIGRSAGSVLGDPNDLSLVLLFPTSFAVGLIFASGLSKFERLLAGVGFFIIVWGIIETQSRGGLLGIMTISGFFAWQKVRSKALLIGGAAVLAPILLVVAGISGRSSGGASEDGIDESAMGRIYAWEAAFKMAVDNPLTGVGLDNFLENYFEYSPHWDGLNHAVHSTWFGILGESGFLGLTVFLCLLTSLLVSLKKALLRVNEILLMEKREGYSAPLLDPVIQPYLYGIIAGFASFCVSGTFLTQGFTWPFYILMALSVSMIKYVDEQCELRKIPGIV